MASIGEMLRAASPTKLSDTNLMDLSCCGVVDSRFFNMLRGGGCCSVPLRSFAISEKYNSFHKKIYTWLFHVPFSTIHILAEPSFLGTNALSRLLPKNNGSAKIWTRRFDRGVLMISISPNNDFCLAYIFISIIPVPLMSSFRSSL